MADSKVGYSAVSTVGLRGNLMAGTSAVPRVAHLAE